MKLLIRVSDSMNRKACNMSSMEDRYIRMPEELRQLCGLEVNGFLDLRTSTGEIVTLKISQAYKEDVESDTVAAYVTSGVFSALKLTNVTKFEQEVEPVDGITLGCDPELFLVNRLNGNIINAGDYFRKYDKPGRDGALVEFRPLPSTDEAIVTDNIFSLIQRSRDVINKGTSNDPGAVMLFGMSNYRGVSAGFHLHFGIPSPLLGKHITKKGIQMQIVKTLDYYVGIPAIIPEGQNDAVRRVSPHIEYGKPGEARIDNRTLEYRVPGGSLLRHPILTKGILALGAVVIQDVISRMRVCTNSFTNLNLMSSTDQLKTIYPNVPNVYELFKTVASIDTTLAFRHLDTIVNDVAQMVGFGKRKESLEAFFSYLYSGAQFGHDIETNWRGYYNERQPREVDVRSTSI